MGVIVFFIIVVCFIVSNAKKASSAGERSRQQRQQMQQMQQMQQRQYGQRPYVPKRPQQPYMPNGQYSGQTVGQNARPQGQIQGQYRGQQQGVRPVNQTGQVHNQTVNNEPKKQSTLEYLEQKAKADQIQHHKEMREDAMRRERASEGRNMGGRYINGDSVPQGCRLCKCGYCGAENVVSAYSGNKYKCYFCWENIN